MKDNITTDIPNSSWINIERITSIDKDGIYYKDDHDNICFIELLPCAKNWEKAYYLPFDPNKYKLRCVGDRCHTGEYPYFELYDTRHTRFFLDCRLNKFPKIISRLFYFNFHSKQSSVFYSMQKRLTENGWTTYDLT